MKYILYIIALSLSLTLLTACSERVETPNTDDTPTDTEGADTVLSNSDDSDNVMYDDDIKLMHTYGEYTNGYMQDGFYNKLYFGEYTYLIYGDYATMRQVFLCSAPNCTHDDESCTARFHNMTDQIGRVTPDYNEERLLMELDTSDGQSVENYLYTAELSGSAREVLVEFEEEYGFAELIGVGERHAYIDYGMMGLIAVDLGSGEQTTLFNQENPNPMTVADYYPDGQYVYIVYYKSDEEFDPTNMVTPSERELIVDRFDAVSGETTNLYTEMLGEDDVLDPVYYGGDLYSENHLDGTVQRVDLETGEKSTLGTIDPNGKSMRDITPIIDGYLSTTLINEEETARYARHMNIETGEMTDVFLSYSSTAMGSAFDIEVRVVKDLGEKLLVRMGETPMQFSSPVGLINHPVSTYALISEQDYFAGVANYEIFDNSAVVEAVELMQ